MPQGSTTFHEAEARLSSRTRDLHRALVSLEEELEAIDWYQQRVDATEDPELRQILEHNREEEVEHAAMVLEWIRRHDAIFAAKLETYLFTEGSIIEREEVAETAESAAAARPMAAEARAPSARCEEGADGLPASTYRAGVRARLKGVGRGGRAGGTPRARRAPRRHLRRSARLGSRRRAPGHHDAVRRRARPRRRLHAERHAALGDPRGVQPAVVLHRGVRARRAGARHRRRRGRGP